MSTGWIVVIVLTVVLAAALVALYFLGKRAEKKRAEQDEQMAATAQTVSMLIIDKKKLRLKDSGLPEIFDEIPIKREVKATVSGLYITKVRGLHGKTTVQQAPKKGVRAWLTRKLKDMQGQSSK